ncbi:MAG: hypothetical protein ACREIA_26570 [Opitutaceae bacterium]
MAAPTNVLRLLLPVVVLALWGSPLSAQSQETAPAVEIRSVKFSTLRPAGAGQAWLEATVELAIRGSDDGGAYARFVDRPQITLALAIRKRDDGYEFLRASTELVSLEAGRAAVRFYIPPEILEREQINTDPYAYAVDVAVRGRAVAAAVASVLRSPEALQSFRDRVAQGAPANDGILVPQHESPFATEYAGDTPTPVRRPR